MTHERRGPPLTADTRQSLAVRVAPRGPAFTPVSRLRRVASGVAIRPAVPDAASGARTACLASMVVDVALPYPSLAGLGRQRE
jgi:hypothetical protein